MGNTRYTDGLRAFIYYLSFRNALFIVPSSICERVISKCYQSSRLDNRLSKKMHYSSKCLLSKRLCPCKDKNSNVHATTILACSYKCI